MAAVLRAVAFGQRSGNDLDVEIPKSDEPRVHGEGEREVTAVLTHGTFAWPEVRYPVLEVDGSGYTVLNVESKDRKNLKIKLGDQIDEGTARFE